MIAVSFPNTAATTKKIFVGLLDVATAEQVTLPNTTFGMRVKTSVMYCSIYEHDMSLARAKFVQ